MNKIIFFLLFLTYQVNAQIKNGVIEYGVIAHMPVPKDSDFVAEQIRKMNANDTLVTYKLNFNNTASYFYIEPVLMKDYESEEDFSSHLMIQPRNYVSIKDSVYKYYENNKLLGQYAINFKKEAKWKLTNETKMIGEYLCYKATSPFFNGMTWFEDNSNLDIEAWYCPKIPVSFGPNGYHGLPGLILELKTAVSTLYTKKIQLNLSLEPQIDDLSTFKIISVGQKRQAMYKLLSTEQQQFINKSENKN